MNVRPLAAQILAYARERLPVTPTELRTLGKPRVVQEWLLTAWRYYAVAIALVLYARFLFEPSLGWLFRRLYPMAAAAAPAQEPSRLERLRDRVRTATQNVQQSGPPEWQVAMETFAGNLHLLAAMIVLFGLWASIRPGLARAEQRLHAEITRGDRALTEGNPVIATQFYLSAQPWASTPALARLVTERVEEASKGSVRPPAGTGPQGPSAESVDADATLVHPQSTPSATPGTPAPSGSPDATMVMQQEGPQRIGPSGRYQLRRMLGAGAMGEVHEAFDTMLERTVALKKLPAHLASDSQFLLRFTQEAKALAKASHASVVQVYDIISDETGTYLALEFVAGGDLGDLIKDKGAMAPAEALKVATQIASGMAFAHRQGIVHRDIKPMNILVTTDRQPKITDFGLAKMPGSAQMTMDGTVMGSPSYMSPEQANGTGADARSDIYAFGITLFEMLTGQTPFQGSSDQVLAQQRTGRVPAPKGAPKALQAIVLRCTEPKPEDRYADADALVADLERVRLRRSSTARKG